MKKTVLWGKEIKKDFAERQDRIYFFPVKRDILGGKVIVKHIGKHL